jgi:hypothetical protein
MRTKLMMPAHAASRLALLAMVAVLGSACGDSTGPNELALAGAWQGTALLPGAFATGMELTQSGNTIAGTLEILGVLDEAFVGTLNPTLRTVAWQVFSGCELWSGTFTMSSDGSQMSGPIQSDLSSCPSGTDSNGTVSVTKQ